MTMSVEKAVQKPATVALVAIDPYLRAVLPFGAVIVALDVLRAPPARRDPLRPPRADHETILVLATPCGSADHPEQSRPHRSAEGLPRVGTDGRETVPGVM